MIKKIAVDMINSVIELQNAIKDDLEDIKNAKHDDLLQRNDVKNSIITNITNLKADLNAELIKELKEGKDVNIYKNDIDALETQLQELYLLNKQLATVVLPIKKIYQDLVDEIEMTSGRKAFEYKA